jgi:hypothetical protein
MMLNRLVITAVGIMSQTRRLLVNGSSHKGFHKCLNFKEINGERRREYPQTLRLIVRGATHKNHAR